MKPLIVLKSARLRLSVRVIVKLSFVSKFVLVFINAGVEDTVAETVGPDEIPATVFNVAKSASIDIVSLKSTLVAFARAALFAVVAVFILDVVSDRELVRLELVAPALTIAAISAIAGVPEIVAAALEAVKLLASRIL